MAQNWSLRKSRHGHRLGRFCKHRVSADDREQYEKENQLYACACGVGVVERARGRAGEVVLWPSLWVCAAQRKVVGWEVVEEVHMMRMSKSERMSVSAEKWAGGWLSLGNIQPTLYNILAVDLFCQCDDSCVGLGRKSACQLLSVFSRMRSNLSVHRFKRIAGMTSRLRKSYNRKAHKHTLEEASATPGDENSVHEAFSSTEGERLYGRRQDGIRDRPLSKRRRFSSGIDRWR
ncbi:hypothetical protein B0H16DRAFT_1446395 [Mycena metata]|uniref:Uncharacterized protein n=1 Tax=Mycena metata TaxID=1033252 RepID=A0AAD7KEN3_9AGAR|nr:hypothetical protein B0H16DRAFT_1446395 [Mycena metata]